MGHRAALQQNGGIVYEHEGRQEAHHGDQQGQEQIFGAQAADDGGEAGGGGCLLGHHVDDAADGGGMAIPAACFAPSALPDALQVQKVLPAVDEAADAAAHQAGEDAQAPARISDAPETMNTTKTTAGMIAPAATRP